MLLFSTSLWVVYAIDLICKTKSTFRLTIVRQIESYHKGRSRTRNQWELMVIEINFSKARENAIDSVAFGFYNFEADWLRDYFSDVLKVVFPPKVQIEFYFFLADHENYSPSKVTPRKLLRFSHGEGMSLFIRMRLKRHLIIITSFCLPSSSLWT